MNTGRPGILALKAFSNSTYMESPAWACMGKTARGLNFRKRSRFWAEYRQRSSYTGGTKAKSIRKAVVNEISCPSLDLSAKVEKRAST